MRSKPALVYSLLFFLSGATGLIYELLWVRVLYQSFGSTIQSVTTVVAAYMGGLGLGAWWFGRQVDRTPRPAVLYGWLEVAIAVFGVLSPLVLGLAHRLYIAMAAGLEPGGGASLALRFGLAALVLLVPTTLMGGTLPVLTRAFMGTDRALLQPSLGRLYGLNTLGAVTGTALAGFVLIEFAGVRASLLGTAAVNLAIGIAAIRLGRRQAPDTPVIESPSAAPRTRPAFALVLLAITAFAALLNEIAWTRVLIMMVGGSVYAFTLILAMFLLGIGLGSAFVGARRPERPDRADTAAWAALAQGITGIGAALLFLFFSVLPLYVMAVFQLGDLGALARLALLGVAIGAVVLVPAIGMGMTFPLLADLAARDSEARGRDVGSAYAVNTAGSILGAVLTGFVLVTVLGSEATLRIGLVANGFAAVGLAVYAARGLGVRTERVMAGAGLGTAALLVAAVSPGWDTRLLDAAPAIYARQPMNATARRLLLSHRGGRQLAFSEGRNATVSVWEGESGRSLRVNGKVDASDRGDMDNQIMAGLAPVAARPRARSALVIGYGSGVTARVVAAAPGMERVRIVEIEPGVLAADSLFHHVNDTVLRRPGVETVVDDARSALQLDPARYDIIVSEPSNPWIAGVATLYTPEFFRIVQRRLAGDGIFCQWVQLYQLSLPIVAGIVHNIRAVFPHVHVWLGASTDIVVLGSARPLTYDPAWIERILGPGGSLHRLGRDWLLLDTPAQYLGRQLLDEAGVARLLARAGLEHRDDRPRLEFVAARRFLGPEVSPYVILDSLVRLGLRTPAAQPPLELVRALARRRRDPGVVPYLETAMQAQPHEGEWIVALAKMRLARADTAGADSLLARAAGTGGSARAAALLGRAIIATARGRPEADAAVRRAMAAGADTAQASAALARLAIRANRWTEAGGHARAALTAARGTFRHPYPSSFLWDALGAIAADAPPALADSVLRYAAGRLESSPRMRQLAIVAALRARRCAAAAAGFAALLEFGVVRHDAPARVRECSEQLERARAADPAAEERRPAHPESRPPRR